MTVTIIEVHEKVKITSIEANATELPAILGCMSLEWGIITCLG